MSGMKITKWKVKVFVVYGLAVASFSAVGFVDAHSPVIIQTPSQNEVLPLYAPEISQALYGNLEGYPHMYEFMTPEKMDLFVEVLVPDIELARNNVSGIILRVNDNGSVKEVARLRAKEASWESFFEPFGGDSYRRGSSYRGEIEPGLYRVEVSTADNVGKYVLGVGTIEDFSIGDYFRLVGKIAEVKVFMGKSAFRVVESPFVYGPILLLFFLGGGVVWFARRRRRARL